MRPSKRRRLSAAALTAVAVVAVAACGGGGSKAPVAAGATSPTPSSSTAPTASSTAASSSASSPSSRVASPPATGTPAIGRPWTTATALRGVISRYNATNNRGNRLDSIAVLRGVDTGAVLAADRAYTAAGRRNGLTFPAFYTAPRQIAVPTTTGSASRYAIAASYTSAKPLVGGHTTATTGPTVSAYVSTANGVRLASSVSIVGSRPVLPTLAAATDGVVPMLGAAGAKVEAEKRVLAVASACATSTPTPLVATSTTCGGLTALRAIPGFTVSIHLGAQTWPAYTVALKDGGTLVIGAAEIVDRVSAPGGILWRQRTIITGLLGSAAKKHILTRRGYVEVAAMSIAMVVPADGGRATLLGLQDNTVSATQIAKPGTGISV